MTKSVKWLSFLGVFVLGILFVVFFKSGGGNFLRREEALYIAVVGPLSGEGDSDGLEMARGISICLEEINSHGGINGRPVKLLRFDDQNDAKLAEQRASEIVEQEQVLAVLGHFYSSTSIAGGEIYQKVGIPAISGSAVSNEVTEGNPWYFRVIFSNRTQATFLAHYIKRILKRDTVSIVYARNSYGTSLKTDFEQAFNKVGGEVKYLWSYDPAPEFLSEKVHEIVEEMTQKTQENDPGMIFLATIESHSVEFVVAMKRRGLNLPIIGDDTGLGTKLSEYPEEVEDPGSLSNGIYATTSIIFDVAGARSQQFKYKILKNMVRIPE